MKFVHSVPLAIVIAVATTGAPSWAAQHDPNAGHHPAAAASAPAAKAMPGKSGPDMARMDTQMKAMRQMHDKMMAAKSPDERNALMAEHMKTMQEGMTMMNGMSSAGMGGTGGMKDDMAAHHQMMEKRMEMMQATMQMMMDRLPAAPTKQ